MLTALIRCSWPASFWWIFCVGAISPPFCINVFCHHQNEERQICQRKLSTISGLSVLLYFRVPLMMPFIPGLSHVAPLSAQLIHTAEWESLRVHRICKN